jgi:hypothetical protein
MASEIISPKTRRAFREYMTSWVLRQIDDEFCGAGIGADSSYDPPDGGQRRRRIEQYLKTVDFKSPLNVSRAIPLFESVLRSAQKTSPSTFDELGVQLGLDGYPVENCRIQRTPEELKLAPVEEMANKFDAEHIRDHVARIQASVESDPASAIGSTKELIETCSKTVLVENNEYYDDAWEIPKLVKATLKVLRLTPEDIPKQSKDTKNAKKATEAMRQLLLNLASIATKLAELRNAVGTGHGHAGRFRGPRPRHARLAVNSASVLLTFMADTFESRARAVADSGQPATGY